PSSKMTAACLGSGASGGSKYMRPVIPRCPRRVKGLRVLEALSSNNMNLPRRESLENRAPSNDRLNRRSVTGAMVRFRRTSVWRMVLPSRRGRKCLTRISTSGNSGIYYCSADFQISALHTAGRFGAQQIQNFFVGGLRKNIIITADGIEIRV